jgi:ribosomal protein S18 acetylase RimI-like enzyme
MHDSVQPSEAIIFERLTQEYWHQLANYLLGLSDETKSRFGPHGYDYASIQDFYSDEHNTGFLAKDANYLSIIGYCVTRIGLFEYEVDRLQSYGYQPNQFSDYMFAPSVADLWQGKGIGTLFFQSIRTELAKKKTRRIFLWGGVQATNGSAIRFYQKNGFKTIGHFSYNGDNLDMVLELPENSN